MLQRYILDGKKPVKCDDIKVWLDFWKDNSNRVAKTTIGNCWIITILQSFISENDSPQLFKTMAFGGLLNGECNYCATWEEAEVLHYATVERVRKAYEESKA